MKKLYFLIIISLLNFGCLSLWSIEHKIGKRIENCKPNINCIIKVAEIADFEWDKMYVFDYGLSPEAIEEILGMSPPDYHEFKRWLVFVKDDKIVYREIEPTDIEGIVNGEVVFTDLANSRHYSFTPETAVFKAEKHNLTGNKVYYSLTRIK